MIEPTLHDDSRWRAMADNRDARLAYFNIRTATRSDYSGFFCYRLDAFASESMFSEAELSNLISLLEQHHFIEYDFTCGWIRIVGWYYGPNAHDNASKVMHRANFYLNSRLPRSQITTNSVAEFVVGSLRRAANFSAKSNHAIEVYTALEDFIRNAAPLFEGLADALAVELHLHGRCSWRHLSGAGDELQRIARIEGGRRVRSSCDQDATTLLPPCSHPADTVAPQRERKESKEKTTAAPISSSATRPLAETLNSVIAKAAMMQ